MAALFAIAVLTGAPASAQTANVGIGTTTPDATAQLDVASTTKGLLIPRMTAAQRVAIQSPTTGLQVYQTDGTAGILAFDGVRWIHQAYGTPVDNTGSVALEVTTLAGSTEGFTDGIGAAAKFRYPNGVAVDGAGNVYVADEYNNRIRKVTPAGVVTTLAGSSTPGSADGTGAAARFQSPAGVAVDGSGNVYVGDYLNHLIRKVTPAGVVTTLAGSGTPGSADGTGAAARFQYPVGVAVDGSGNVYVADQGNHLIRKVTPAGVVTTLAGSTQGYVDSTGTAAKFSFPAGVAADASGDVYVADGNNNRIRKVTPAGVVTTLADGTGAAAGFSNPAGVAVDGAGNVYVAELSSNRIRKVTPAGLVATLAGSGTTGFADGTGAAARFTFPRGVAVDGAGNVYVGDRNNHRIRKVGVPVYATTASLSNYATTASLSDYATTASLSSYATTASLSDYVTTSGAQTIGGVKTFSSDLVANGKLGIGTSSPNAPLQLANTIANRKVVLYETTNNDHQFFGFGINTSILRYQVAHSSNDHVFFRGDNATTSTELMRIKGTGNVGIGVPAPAQKLDVAGTVQATSFVGDGGSLTNVVNTSGAQTIGGVKAFSSAVSAPSFSGDGSGLTGIVNTTSAQTIGGVKTFSANVVANGNVGIGTSSPNAPLQLANTLANRKVVLYETTNNDHQFLGLGINIGMLRYQVANAGDDHVFFRGDNATTSTELMRIKGTGNVGIGIPAPAQKLDVAGTVQATSFLGDGGSLTGVVNTSGAQTIGGVKTFSGNVGVGIAPAFPLHLGGTAQIMTKVQSSNVYGTWSTLSNTSTGAGGWDFITTGSANTEGAGKLLIRSEATATVAATFQSNGYVGIGTTNAVAPLTLNGGGSDAFAIQSGGDVRIWNDNNTANVLFYASGGGATAGNPSGNSNSILLLQSDGKIFAFNGTGGSVSSDRRLKQDITPLEHSLEKVLRLNGYTYRFKTKADVAQKEVGVIAQEVQAVLPEAVSENADGTLAVSYNSLVPLLINAVKEQQEKIEAQQAQIEEMKRYNTSMAAQVKEMQQMLGMQPRNSGAKVGRR